jgi:secreted Zn-dependent insulinase-like peptidase
MKIMPTQIIRTQIIISIAITKVTYLTVGFSKALDRFSQFFISPLFNQNFAQKEIQVYSYIYNLIFKAIQNEFDMILCSNNCRVS